MNEGILEPEILARVIKNLIFLASLLVEFDELNKGPTAFRTQRGREHLITLRTLFCQIIGGLSQLHALSYNHHPWNGIIHGYIKRVAFTVAIIQTRYEGIKDEELPDL